MKQFNGKKLLILGHGQHGKDSAAEIIQHETGLKFVSSSQAALDVIRPLLTIATGITDPVQLFNTRSWHRPLWHEAIKLYNSPDKTALCRYVLAISDVYVGMRCKYELAACRGLFDHVFWVDASERKPPESEASMSIKFDPGYMIKINNNGNEKDLIWEVKKALNKALGE